MGLRLLVAAFLPVAVTAVERGRGRVVFSGSSSDGAGWSLVYPTASRPARPSVRGDDLAQRDGSGEIATQRVDLLRMRTREGMAIARAKGRLNGKTPKLSARQRVHVLNLVHAGDHTIGELAELFSVSRATIYREIARARRGPTYPVTGRSAQRSGSGGIHRSVD